MVAMSAEIRLRGTPVAPGIALGRACFFRCQSKGSAAVKGDVTVECRRMEEALAWMDLHLQQLARETEARLSPDEAGIFQAHRMMVDSDNLRRELLRSTGEGLSAEAAVKLHFDRQRACFLDAESGVLRQRAADLTEIARELLHRLQRSDCFLQCMDMARCRVGHCTLNNDHILAVDELTPGLTMEMDDHTVGFLAQRAGTDSHAAILARTLGLPLVSDIADPRKSIPLDAPILLDGDRGEVVLYPTPQTLAHYRDRMAHRRRPSPAVHPVSGLEVYANVDNLAGVYAALRAEAEGIGLYRTEMEVLAAKRLLSEEEQAANYRQVSDAVGDRPVYIRLLDLGSDKVGDWLHMPAEDNPALGCRGIRLLLQRPEILRAQARALAKAAVRRSIHVIYPMITDLDQFLEARALFEAAVTDLKPAKLLHGVLFEVPSSCLQARAILEQCDFGCIGTNDLIQYLFAEDRGRSAAGTPERPRHEALWGLIGEMARVGRELGKRLSICGECAGDPGLLDRVRMAGIDTVSVSPARIGEIRRAFLAG